MTLDIRRIEETGSLRPFCCLSWTKVKCKGECEVWLVCVVFYVKYQPLPEVQHLKVNL